MATKQCTLCLDDKQLKEFNNHRGGKHPMCRECQRLRRKASYAKHRADELRRMRKFHDARKHTDLTYVLGIRLDSARRRAQQFGWACDITIEHLRELYEKAPYCALTRVPFDLTQKRLTVSLDRIDSAVGYVIGNVRLITYHVNVALNEFGDAHLYELARALLANAPTPS